MTRSTEELRALQAFVRQLPLFADLTPSDVAQLCRSSRRLVAAPGEVVIEEGTQGDALYVILSGALEITRRDGDGEIVLATRKAGEVLGEMSLLERAPRSASARATQESELLEIGPESFRAVLESNPTTASTILRTITGRLRSTEASLMQREKLASLGTLAAGLAHELNNPAAAIQRSSEYLSEAFENWRGRSADLHMLDMSLEQRERLHSIERSIVDCGVPRSDSDVSGRAESDFISWLESLEIEEPWEIAPALLSYGWNRKKVEQLLPVFAGVQLNAIMQWLGAGLAAQKLIEEIRQSAAAISGIVRAVKTYAYLDQAPIQEVDLRSSLEDTLVILHHKLKAGVEVVREFDEDLPLVEAYASELNQVWTNIIDNGIHAMDGRGTLTLGARRIGDHVEITIGDTGAGIPEEIRSRLFDPFFTTKPPGVGSGLGLHIAHNIIVNQHHGRLDFESAPGRTEFRITLPIRLRKAVRAGSDDNNGGMGS